MHSHLPQKTSIRNHCALLRCVSDGDCDRAELKTFRQHISELCAFFLLRPFFVACAFNPQSDPAAHHREEQYGPSLPSCGCGSLGCGPLRPFLCLGSNTNSVRFLRAGLVLVNGAGTEEPSLPPLPDSSVTLVGHKLLTPWLVLMGLLELLDAIAKGASARAGDSRRRAAGQQWPQPYITAVMCCGSSTTATEDGHCMEGG